MNLRLARFPSVDRLCNFSWQLCPMHRVRISRRSVKYLGGGETECIHGSVRCLAAKVTGRGCHLPLDPLHVQISKNPDGHWNGGVYCGNLQRACVPVAGGMHGSARPSVDTSGWRYARRRRTKVMLQRLLVECRLTRLQVECRLTRLQRRRRT